MYLNQYETFGDAEDRIDRFIDHVYNQKQLHSSLCYLPSAEYESLYTTAKEHRHLWSGELGFSSP